MTEKRRKRSILLIEHNKTKYDKFGYVPSKPPVIINSESEGKQESKDQTSRSESSKNIQEKKDKKS